MASEFSKPERLEYSGLICMGKCKTTALIFLVF